MFVYVGDILVFACLKTFQKHITLLHPLLLYSVYIVFRCEHRVTEGSGSFIVTAVSFPVE